MKDPEALAPQARAVSRRSNFRPLGKYSGGFTQIPDAFLYEKTLTLHKALLLSALLRFRKNNDSGIVNVSQRYLADCLNIDAASLSKRLQELKSDDWITGSRGSFNVEATVTWLKQQKVVSRSTKVVSRSTPVRVSTNGVNNLSGALTVPCRERHLESVDLSFIQSKSSAINNWQQVKDFHQELFADSTQYMSLISLDRNKKHRVTWHKNSDDIAAQASDLVAAGQDVYFGLGTCSEKRPAGKRGDSQTVTGIPGFWLDVDLQSDAHTKHNLPDEATARELLAAFPLQPSMIVNSGNGLHVYYLFNEPWIFENDSDRQQAKELSRRFQLTMKAHFAASGYHLDMTADLARILRLPGTFNFKNAAEPKPVEILERTEARYEASDFQEHLIADPEQPEKRTFTTSSSGILPETDYAQAGRNNSIASRAGMLLNAGYSFEDSNARCQAWNEQLPEPLSQSEVFKTVKSVCKTVENKQLVAV